MSGPTTAVCRACGRPASSSLGILDLRETSEVPAFVDPVAQRLHAAFAQRDFAGLVALRLADAPASSSLRTIGTRYHIGHIERGARMSGMFHDRACSLLGPHGHTTAVDLGCGSGASLPWLAGRYAHVIGIDISLANLILARKTLEENHLFNVTLALGSGYSIPCLDGRVDYVQAVNVFEHVSDLGRLLDQIQRILAPGGRLVADSRNRYDVFLPEPHVQLRWIGFLPPALARRYIYAVRRVSYEGTYLRSYGELQTALRDHLAGTAIVTFSMPTGYGARPWADRAIQRLEQGPVLAGLILRFYPSFLVLARKNAGGVDGYSHRLA